MLTEACHRAACRGHLAAASRMPTPADIFQQEQREELRYAIRRYLYARPTAAVSADTIRHAMRVKGFEVSAEEIEAALNFWMGTNPQQVMGHLRQHSALPSYQITTAGVVAEERGE